MEGLLAPHALSYQPVCILCGRHLDSWELVEEMPERVRIIGKHHGAEQLVTLELGTRNYDDGDITRALRGVDFFHPKEV